MLQLLNNVQAQPFTVPVKEKNKSRAERGAIQDLVRSTRRMGNQQSPHNSFRLCRGCLDKHWMNIFGELFIEFPPRLDRK